MTEQGRGPEGSPAFAPGMPEPLAPGALGGGPAAQLGDLLPAPRDEASEAFTLAYRRVARRDHTEEQLRERLVRAGFDAEIVSEVLATLTAQGYIDDDRFITRFIEDRRELDGWGAQRIRMALRAAGARDQAVEAQLAVNGADEELAAAISLLHSRFSQPPHDERSRSKALGLLLRRGYESDVAYDAVRAFERES